MQAVHLKDCLLTLLICSLTMAYALRIDSELDKVKAWALRHGLGGFAVREVAGDNEHWHFFLEGDKTIKQLRCSFNREVPELKGNGAYSLTECRDVDKYVRYLAKGESDGQMPELAWSNSILYDEEKLSELHDAYWSENRNLKKRKAGSMIDWVVDEAKRTGVEWHKREQLAKIYIRELGVRSKPINIHAVRANLNAVQYALCPDDTCLQALSDSVSQF